MPNPLPVASVIVVATLCGAAQAQVPVIFAERASVAPGFEAANLTPMPGARVEQMDESWASFAFDPAVSGVAEPLPLRPSAGSLQLDSALALPAGKSAIGAMSASLCTSDEVTTHELLLTPDTGDASGDYALTWELIGRSQRQLASLSLERLEALGTVVFTTTVDGATVSTASYPDLIDLETLRVAATVDPSGAIDITVTDAADPATVWHDPPPAGVALLSAAIRTRLSSTALVPGASRAVASWSGAAHPTGRNAIAYLAEPVPLSIRSASGAITRYDESFDLSGIGTPGSTWIVGFHSQPKAVTGPTPLPLDGVSEVNAALVSLSGARATVYTTLRKDEFALYLSAYLSRAYPDAVVDAWIPAAWSPRGCGNPYVSRVDKTGAPETTAVAVGAARTATDTAADAIALALPDHPILDELSRSASDGALPWLDAAVFEATDGPHCAATDSLAEALTRLTDAQSLADQLVTCPEAPACEARSAVQLTRLELTKAADAIRRAWLHTCIENDACGACPTSSEAAEALEPVPCDVDDADPAAPLPEVAVAPPTPDGRYLELADAYWTDHHLVLWVRPSQHAHGIRMTRASATVRDLAGRRTIGRAHVNAASIYRNAADDTFPIEIADTFANLHVAIEVRVDFADHLRARMEVTIDDGAIRAAH